MAFLSKWQTKNRNKLKQRQRRDEEITTPKNDQMLTFCLRGSHYLLPPVASSWIHRIKQKKVWLTCSAPESPGFPAAPVPQQLRWFRQTAASRASPSPSRGQPSARREQMKARTDGPANWFATTSRLIWSQQRDLQHLLKYEHAAHRRLDVAHSHTFCWKLPTLQ